MPPSATSQVLLSPAELSYLHTSLSLSPPIRSDGRSATQFRPLIAETGILPGTNGSARICFADGSEAIVGVKAEIEKSLPIDTKEEAQDIDIENLHFISSTKARKKQKTNWNVWVDVDVELPGYRDDDAMPVLLASIITEALLADGQHPPGLYINRRFHWKLYIDILLLSHPLSYPLPLLSLTSHLALLSTRLPRLKSEEEDDPLFDDDWDAAIYLYPRGESNFTRPPLTLLVMAVKDNIIFDPSREELAVAEVVLAISIGVAVKDTEDSDNSTRNIKLLSVRTIDPPSRLAHPGVPNALNAATRGLPIALEDVASKSELYEEEGVWQPPRGGAKRKLITTMIRQVLVAGGVADEVLDGLETVELS
ncbi:Exosome complex component RRP42 [Erysiphe neolycopersici]|uniref:Ribosomal RNA-processing protein 42 n=1 Tax=Erysiphe neolycopersici TaxID=212602 RepID=A0A420HVI1_9PEZI|nr:Exosome complex component RRP42 [Erysiphe neolycopersici]